MIREDNMSTAVITVVHDAENTPSTETLEQLSRISATSARPFRVELLSVDAKGASSLRDVLRPAATVGRRGGDERHYFTTSLVSKDSTVETARLLEHWNAVFLGVGVQGQHSRDGAVA
ncbi:Hypothetical protein, putative [Bodo saltans]|uniref:Uncharacterized protein n=1 Tax=Bodo saltans TaxID=75058 RepID=A0A0S4KHU9_BODSA|nr:Hypothetical protein, putative [Bodo saltans]|eukprot:CUI15256.1 Hypothetical protein, putative [Bodo saltans]